MLFIERLGAIDYATVTYAGIFKIFIMNEKKNKQKRTNAKCKCSKDRGNSVCNVVIVGSFMHKLGQDNPPSPWRLFAPQGFFRLGDPLSVEPV